MESQMRRAALEWTEAVTLLREGRVPAGSYRSPLKVRTA